MKTNTKRAIILTLIITFVMMLTIGIAVMVKNNIAASKAAAFKTDVQKIAGLYRDEARAKEDLEAMKAAGILDENGKMVSLDLRESGKSVSLSFLAEKISSGEEVGVITVNGKEATAEQVVQIAQVNAAIEIAELLDSQIEVTDQHVKNLESFLAGIQSGKVNLTNAVKTGALKLNSTENTASEQSKEVELPELPETSTGTGELALTNGDKSYTGAYVNGSVYNPSYAFPRFDTEDETSKYYFTDSRYSGVGSAETGVGTGVVSLSFSSDGGNTYTPLTDKGVIGGLIQYNNTKLFIKATLNEAQPVSVSFDWKISGGELCVITTYWVQLYNGRWDEIWDYANDKYLSGTITWEAGDTSEKTIFFAFNKEIEKEDSHLGYTAFLFGANNIKNATFDNGRNVFNQTFLACVPDGYSMHNYEDNRLYGGNYPTSVKFERIWVAPGTYFPGEIMPVTVIFDNGVYVDKNTKITVNGTVCDILCSEGEQAVKITFGYTVKENEAAQIIVTSISGFKQHDGTKPMTVFNFESQSVGASDKVFIASDAKVNSINLANAKFGIDDGKIGEQVVTVVIPLSGSDLAWVTSEAVDISSATNGGFQWDIPGFNGKQTVANYIAGAYFSYDDGKTRYPAYLVGEGSAIVTRFVAPENSIRLLRKDTVELFVDPLTIVDATQYIPNFSSAKQDAKGFYYFDNVTNAKATLFSGASYSYYVKGDFYAYFDESQYVSRTAEYEVLPNGYIKLTNPSNADFPYLKLVDAAHPEHQYDVEIMMTEDAYNTFVARTFYMGGDEDRRITYQVSDRLNFSFADDVVFQLDYLGSITPLPTDDENPRIAEIACTELYSSIIIINLNVPNGGTGRGYTLNAGSLRVLEGMSPFLNIPRTSRVRTTLTGFDTEILFSSNVTMKNSDYYIDYYGSDNETDFNASLYKINESDVGQPLAEGAIPVTVGGDWGTYKSTKENPLTRITVPGSALAEPGAYAVVISVDYYNSVTSGTLNATAYIVVKNGPVTAKLDTLNRYHVGSNEIPSINYTLIGAANSVKVEYTIQKSGSIIGERTSVTGGKIPFEPEKPTGLKESYTITLYARNSEEDAWSVDSMILTVYNSDALKLLIRSVERGEIGGSTGGVVDNDDDGTKEVTGDTVVGMDNHSKLSDYGITAEEYRLIYSDFDALRTDMGLQEIVSANYGSGVWGMLSDRMSWESDDPDKVSVDYQQGGYYSDVRNYNYVSYPPATDFLLVGKEETGDNLVTITATHANTGMQASVKVSVKKLTNQLYLFQFYPKVKTSVFYRNGDGIDRLMDTDSEGRLAVYEPKGIASGVMALAQSEGEYYVGTIFAEKLVSGERDIASLQVYPCNNLVLRPISGTTLTFLTPEGKPYDGAVTLRVGVYKNGIYCPEAEVKIDKNSAEGSSGRQDIKLTAVKGKISVWFDPDQFRTNVSDSSLQASDSVSYVFEYRFDNAYQPGYLITSAGANTVVQLQRVKGNAKTPQIIRQGYQQYLNGTTPTSYTRNVIDSTDNIGISPKFPKAVLSTAIALPGESVRIDGVTGYSAYDGENVVKFAFYTTGGKKLTGQTDLLSESAQATQITNLSQLDSATYFVFPFSSVPMLRSVYVMTDADMRADGIDDTAKTPTARVKAVFTRGGMTVSTINMPFGVTNVSNQPDLSNKQNGADAIGKEVRDDLRKKTDIGAIFRSVNVNDMIKNGFVFLGNLKGDGGDNPVNLMILPTQDPAVFRIIALVGENGRQDDDDDGDGVSVNYNPNDLAEDYNKLVKELEESGKKKGSDSDGEGKIEFNFYGTIILEARADVLNGEWDIAFRGGNVGTNVSGKYEWGQTFMCGPVPAFISFETGFHADLDVAFGNKGTARAMLLDAAMGVSIEAFAGLGFDVSIVKLQLGIYGNIGADVNFLLLTPSDAAVSTGTKLTISGEIGIKLKVKVLFVSYSKKFASTGFNWTKKWNQYDQIQNYWTDQGYGQLFGVTKSGRAYKMLLFADGSAAVAIDGGAELESRDYLELEERVWMSGATSGRRLLRAASSLTDVQTNAYPYSNPVFTDDGEMFLYISDNDNAEKAEGVTSFAVKNGNGYENMGRVDTSEGNVLADLDVVASGTRNNAFAAWVKQIESPKTDTNYNTEITNDDLGMMFNATEVYAASYNGAAWTSTRLTDNFVADMSPTVASYDNKAIVAWRSMNASSMTANDDITAVFNVENNINYRIYNGTEWTSAKIAYNGSAGSVNALSSAMLPDGTGILTYTVRTGDDVRTTETFYTVIGADGNILTTGRLTNDNYTDANAQVTAVNEEGGYFLLGWYSEHDAGEGTSADYDADGTATQKAVVAHDIRLARINKNGSYSVDFPESIGGTGNSSISSDFHFSAPTKNEKLENVSIVWSQRKDSSKADDAGKYELNAVRFFKANNAIGVTAPMKIAETAKNYTIDHFDAYTDLDGAVHAIILGSDYDKIEGISVYDSIDLNAAANNSVTSNSDAPNNLDILDGEAISSMKLATGTFPEIAADVTVLTNINEVIPGLTTPVQFTVKNTGTGTLTSIMATVGYGSKDSVSKDFTLNLLPNASAMLIMNYPVPEGAVSNVAYALTSEGEELGRGTLEFNRPDVGISAVKLIREENGERDIQVRLSNDSNIPLAGSGKTVKLAFYQDVFYQNNIGEELTISAEEYADIDEGIYTLVHTIAVTDLYSGGGEIPEEGLSVYVRVWVEDTEEPITTNNIGFVSFQGLLTRNNGAKLTTDTSLEEDNGGYTMYAQIRNNSVFEVNVGIPVAVLLNSEGKVIAHKNIQDDELLLGCEAQRDLSATFTAEEIEGTPAQAEIRYLYTVSFDVNGGTGEYADVTTDIFGHIVLPETNPTAPENEPALFFRGWYTKSTDGDLITENTIFTDKTTVYARYTSHQHVFECIEYSGDTVTVKCVSTVDDDCPLEDVERTVTLTIVVPERAATGYGMPNATIIGAIDKFGMPEICYYTANANGERGDALSVAPVDAGKYWAEIGGIQNGTAHVAYEIPTAESSDGIDPYETHTLTYNVNGGTGAVAGGTFYVKSNVEIANGDGISKPNLVFDGWNTKADGSGDAYQPGDKFEILGDTTFYAQWKHVHIWSLTFDEGGKVFTATCSVPGCPHSTLTLQPEAIDKMYDGENAKPYACSAQWTEENGLPLPTVTYYQNGKEVSEAKNVGSYTAIVSLNGTNVEVSEFHVTKRPVVVTANDLQKHAGEDDPVFTGDQDVVGDKFCFENDKTHPWTIVTEGERVYVKSGNGGVKNSTSTITLKVELEKTGTISFDYKYGTEDGFDYCYFKVDGKEKLKVSGVGDWQTSTGYNLSAGKHTFTWSYSKDGSGDKNGDFFAVDNVVITREGAVTQANADTNELTRALNKFEGGVLDGDTLNYTLTREEGEDEGTYSVTVVPGENPNYDVQVRNGTFTILETLGKKQTIDVSDITATYGDTGVNLNAKITLGDGTLGYVVKEGDAVSVDEEGNLTILKAGTVVISVSASQTENFGRTSKRITVTVNPKEMTVSANNLTETVNGKPHGVKVTVTDPIEGYTVKYGTSEGTYNLTESPTITEEGTLTVYYQVTAENYVTSTGKVTLTLVTHMHNFTYIKGTGEKENTIIATCSAEDCPLENRTATLTIAAPTRTVYGGEGSVEATVTNAIEDVDTPTIVYMQGETVLASAPTNAGTYTASITLGEGETAVTASVTYTIEKKALTITANEKTITYGDEPTNNGVKYEGFISGETESVLSGTLAFEYSYSQFGDVGTYTITPKGLTSGNYEITFESGTLTVTEKPITVTIQSATSVYGDEQATLTATTAEGAIVNGDTGVYTLACEVTKESGVGTYAIVGTDTSDNYLVTFEGGEKAYQVTAREIEIVWTHTDDLAYNKKAQQPTATASNLVNGDEVSLTVTGEGTFVGEDYSASAAFATAQANYILPEEVSTTFSILPKPITVTIEKKSSVYGEKQVELSATTEEGAIEEGDEEVYELTSEVNEKTPVGSYAIQGETLNENYSITFENAENGYQVTARVIGIVWSGMEGLVYNKTAQKPGAIATNLVNGDRVSLTVTGEQVNAGEGYEARAAFATAQRNYALPSNASTTFSIAEKPITVTIQSATSVYKEAQATLSATTEEGAIEEGDTGVYSLYCEVNEGTDVGFYDILGTDTSENYLVTFVGEKNAYEVTKRAMIATAEEKTVQCGETLPEYTFSVSEEIAEEDRNELKEKTSFACEADSLVPGKYEISFSFADGYTGETALKNYSVTLENGTLYILTKALTDNTSEETKAVEILLENSEDAFDYNISVEIDVLSTTETESSEIDYEKVREEFVNRRSEISKVYSIKLYRTETVDGVETLTEIQPSDIEEGLKLVIKMEIPEYLTGRNFRILHIHSEEDIEYIAEENIERKDGYAFVTIDRLSDFAFVHLKDSEEINHKGFCLGWLGIVLDALVGVLFAVAVIKRGKKNLRVLGFIAAGAVTVYALVVLLLHLCYASIVGMSLAAVLLIAFFTFFLLQRKGRKEKVTEENK